MKQITCIYFAVFTTMFSVTSSQGNPALILTPYINSKRTKEARLLSKVDPTHFLNVSSHSGFLTVDEQYNSNLFFWYFPNTIKPINETPWIVWLQGGPGASSIAGLFDEIGPFEYENYGIKARPWPWTKDHSVVFIDNPIGAGFSFTNNDKGFIEDMSTCGTHLYKALRQFVTLFPELRKAPLYLAGESYAGRYLPAIGLKILEQDNNIGPLDVNLQGIIMGNPVLDRGVIADYSAIYYQWGLIDSQGLQAVKPLQDKYIQAIRNEDSVEAYDLRNELLNRLSDISMQQQGFNVLQDNLENKLKNFMDYIMRSEVKNSIHAGSIQFTFSNYTVHTKLIGDFLSGVTWKFEKLLEHYRILIYCGQLDLTTPCVPNARERLKNWHWKNRDYFLKAPRTPWEFNESIAGYVKSGGGLTEVLVRGAGHLAPMDKPAELQFLVSSFIRGIDLPLPSNYEILSGNTPDYVEPEEEGSGVSGTKIVMILSVVINVMLVVVIGLGVVKYLRWQKRNDASFYNVVEETSITEGVLTMT